MSDVEEVDETYISGKFKNMQAWKKYRAAREAMGK